MDISTYLLIAIAYIPLNVFDLYIISQYMNALYGFPRKGPYLKLAKIISVIGASFLCAPYTALWGIAVICNILLPFYNAGRQKKIIFQITLLVLAMTSLFTAFALGESMTLPEFTMGAFVILCPHIIFFLICKLAEKVCAPTEVELPYTMWFPLLAIPIISILGVAYISYLATHSSLSIEDSNMLQFPLLLMCLLVNIIVFYLYGKLSELVQKRVQSALFEQQLHLQEEHYQALISAHEQIRSIRHDMKNHLEAISLLAAEHKDREIGEYLNEITSQIRLSDDTIFTGNSGIDAILNLKINEAAVASTKLPSIRILAQQYNCNPSTICRALNELVLDGLVIRKQGRGYYVVDDVLLIQEKRRSEVEKLTMELFSTLSALGYKHDEILELIFMPVDKVK